MCDVAVQWDLSLTVGAEWFPIAESDEDLGYVHEAMDKLAKSTATKTKLSKKHREATRTSRKFCFGLD